MKLSYKTIFLHATIALLALNLIMSARITLADEPAAEGAPATNGTSAFPNKYHPPTTPEQVPESQYKPPKLSLALYETDPSRKLRRPDFVSVIKYSQYSLSRGDAEQIFYFADANHDDLLSHDEWNAFVGLYVLPFEACSADGNYILNLEEFTKCYNADPKTKSISYLPKKYPAVPYELLMQSITRKVDNEMNFAEYLTFRRALYGWQQCHSGSTLMNVSSFKCGLLTAFPQKYNLKIDLEQIYHTGVYGDRTVTKLDFVGFLKVSNAVQVFSLIASPQDSPYLEKQQFIKAVREDRSPSLFTEVEVETMFSLINKNVQVNKFAMDFGSFAFYFNLHRLFVKYSQERPAQLTEQEFDNLLNDPFAPSYITLAIDYSTSNLPETDYLEGSLVLQHLRASEREFYSFLQDDGETAAPAAGGNFTFYDHKPNEGNRKVFFKTFAGVPSNYWDFAMYYRAFTIANLYTFLSDLQDKRWIVSATTLVDQISDAYDKVTPSIAMNLRTNYVFYKALPREVFIDLLTFAAIENWNHKVSLLQNKGTYVLISEVNLKVIMADFGMQHIPDSVIDLTKKGYDSLHRRVYDPAGTFRNILLVHATALEHRRTQTVITETNLKLQADPSRAFPDFNRRFDASPLA